MRIRSLLKTTATALVLGGLLGAAGLAGDATAAEKRVTLKMGSAFPSKLVQLGSLGVSVSKKVERISGGNLRLKFFEPHALVPPLEMFDAIAAGSLDAAWSTPGYWVGKDEAFAMFSAVPFGPSAGEYTAWLFYGGGKELMDELYGAHGIKSLPCGVIAPEASGWFRKEINSIDDLKGLKMRFFGMGAKVMEKVGVSTQLIAGGDIFPALERGSIDATEYSMPAIDLNLGFYQVAKHYYFPGWHQQATLFDLMISKKKWGELSDMQKAQLEVACGDNFREGLAEGEAIQGKALAELKAKGVTIHRWSPEILGALNEAWLEVAGELSASNPNFKKVWDSLQTFRAEYAIWKDLGYL
ncbi:MAG: TRAP transporter substrate-binding protein [Rhodospirillales bacterium]|nr:TRAP transporter substrate-binding protein [Rhodospirillales bacterium]